MFFNKILHHFLIRRPSPVKSKDGDHSKLLTNKASIRIISQSFRADLFPMFLFGIFIAALQLLKEIPVKILVPLLENSSLEESDDLQDKWAKMLTNMVDSELNLQNQIFPYLLSQISLQEFNQLKQLSVDEKEFIKEKREFEEKNTNNRHYYGAGAWSQKKRIEETEQRGLWIDLEEYERANLIRLGLIRELPPRVYVREFKTGGYEHEEQWHQLEAEYDHGDIGYRMTELGERFLEICDLREKNSESN